MEEQLVKVCKMYERKLSELMTEKEYARFIKHVASEVYAPSEQENADYKDFVLQNNRIAIGGVE